jgi:hypothetical protein
VVDFTPRPLYRHGEQIPVPIEQEAGWAPMLVWTFRGREKFFAPAGILSPGLPAPSPVALLTELSRLQHVPINIRNKLGRPVAKVTTSNGRYVQFVCLLVCCTALLFVCKTNEGTFVQHSVAKLKY